MKKNNDVLKHMQEDIIDIEAFVEGIDFDSFIATILPPVEKDKPRVLFADAVSTSKRSILIGNFFNEVTSKKEPS